MVLIWEYQLLLSILPKVFKPAFIKTGCFTKIFHLEIFTIKYFTCQMWCTLKYLIVSYKSLMWMRNTRGPSMETWGTHIWPRLDLSWNHLLKQTVACYWDTMQTIYVKLLWNYCIVVFSIAYGDLLYQMAFESLQIFHKHSHH